MENNYTKSGLLIISENVVRILMRDYKQRKKEGPQSLSTYCEGLVETNLTENPKLKILLREIEKDFSQNPKAFNAFSFGLISMYELFRKQAETNELEKRINNQE